MKDLVRTSKKGSDLATLNQVVLGVVLFVGIQLGACSAHRAPIAQTLPVNIAAAPAAADLPLPDAIPGSFTVRQKLVAQSDHGGGSFEAVLAKSDGRLMLIGLLPYGARAFVLDQKGSDVQFTNYLPREPPFPPTWMLLDVYRVFGTWLGEPPRDGEREATTRGERIRERWQAGRLVERTFVRAAADPAGIISITYEGMARPGFAEKVTLRNGRFGYQLSIHTLPGLPPP
jgi:Protein of unknown function (DUF3261)